MKHPELSALILRNLKDFDAAARLWETETEPSIDQCCKEIVESWATLNDWEPNIFRKSKSYAISNSIWRLGEADWKAHVYFHVQDNISDSIGGESDWISNFCGLNGYCGFAFYVNATKSKLNVASQQFLEKMLSKGFKFLESEKIFFVPINITTEKLAEAMETDNLEKTIEPVIFEALDKLNNEKDILNQIVITVNS